MTDHRRDERSLLHEPAEGSADAFVEADATDEAVLEHHYRRLLRFYPEPHRRAHGDRMVAELMAGSADGQIYPTTTERWRLLTGGLRTRSSLVTSRPTVRTWLDIVASAVVVLTVMYAALSILTVVLAVSNGMLRELPVDGMRGVRVVVAQFVGWSIAALAVLTGRDRVAGVCALAVTTLTVWTWADGVLRAPFGPSWSGALLSFAPDLLLPVVVVIGLLGPGMADRGRELLGRALVGVAGATLAGALYSVAVAIARASAALLVGSDSSRAPDALATIVMLATVVGVAATATLAYRRKLVVAVATIAVLAVIVLVEPIAQYLLLDRHVASSAIAWTRLGTVVLVPLAAAALLAPTIDHDDDRAAAAAS